MRQSIRQLSLFFVLTGNGNLCSSIFHSDRWNALKLCNIFHESIKEQLVCGSWMSPEWNFNKSMEKVALLQFHSTWWVLFIYLLAEYDDPFSGIPSVNSFMFFSVITFWHIAYTRLSIIKCYFMSMNDMDKANIL